MASHNVQSAPRPSILYNQTAIPLYDTHGVIVQPICFPHLYSRPSRLLILYNQVAIPLYNPHSHIIVQPRCFPQLYSWPSRHSILHNQIQPCTVQPSWSRPCTAIVASYTVQTKHTHTSVQGSTVTLCTAIMASHDIQPAIVALASYDLEQSSSKASPLYNKVWLSIVRRQGNPTVTCIGSTWL